MARTTLLFVALAAFFIHAQGEEIVFQSRALNNVDPVEFGAVKDYGCWRQEGLLHSFYCQGGVGFDFVICDPGLCITATGRVLGIPKTIESNLPASLNNIAISYAQNVLTTAPNLVAASQQLKTKLQNYDRTQQWSVAIEPAAYYVTSYYFAHYLVENYNVFVYTVNCGHL